MKKAAVRELRNHYADLLDDVAAGEEVIITRRGEPVAKLGPIDPVMTKKVDWSSSAEVKRVRAKARRLSAAERNEVLRESSGRW